MTDATAQKHASSGNPLRTARTIALVLTAVVTCLLISGSTLDSFFVSGARPAIAQSAGQALPTYTELPAGAQETYPGSKLYKAPISEQMAAGIDRQAQENWTLYHIAPESNLGLPLGSIYLTTPDNQYVELAIYERAAFTPLQGSPARQILNTILSEGKVLVSESQSVTLPDGVKAGFLKLPIAGESSLTTPSVGQMAALLSTDKTKAVDAAWTRADQQLSAADGSVKLIDSKMNVQALELGQADSVTGHRVPVLVSDGLSELFGQQLVQNVGMPLVVCQCSFVV